ncbi:Rrf2 family transcriptional regulator [Bosea sp. 2YAB26]|uniref:RrF2 family transcriptional regulator n=1 Tax=Bosea sp. 2YAB26 TaxID=3237478 RepID=UPI003F8FBA56
MRLTSFSDYSLRILMYAAAKSERLITIEETSLAYGISRAHLMKVANLLTKAGFLRAVRGRSGGLVLARLPTEIGIGEVLRLTEPDFALVECFGSGNGCLVTSRCRLKGILHEALAAFLSTIDRYTLADLMLRPEDFGIRPAA